MCVSGLLTRFILALFAPLPPLFTPLFTPLLHPPPSPASFTRPFRHPKVRRRIQAGGSQLRGHDARQRRDDPFHVHRVGQAYQDEVESGLTPPVRLIMRMSGVVTHAMMLTTDENRS